MGFRFWRRKKIGPGITFNISKGGGSLSFGSRGAKFTIGKRGLRKTFGIPGTGLFYTTTSSQKKTQYSTQAKQTVENIKAVDRLTLGFFRQLITPEKEKNLVNGLKEIVLKNNKRALEYLKQASHLPDGAYLAGFLALEQNKLKSAKKYLIFAYNNYTKIGKYFRKYGVSTDMFINITENVVVHIKPDRKGILLGLVEVYQNLQDWQKAIKTLDLLKRIDPDDIVIKLSLVELLLEYKPNDKETLKKIIKITKNIENESMIHTAILWYKGKALMNLGLYEAALETLTKAFRKKKDRSQELLNNIRYDRITVYEKLGRKSSAKKEIEKLYSESPDFKDIEQKL